VSQPLYKNKIQQNHSQSDSLHNYIIMQNRLHVLLLKKHFWPNTFLKTAQSISKTEL